MESRQTLTTESAPDTVLLQKNSQEQKEVVVPSASSVPLPETNTRDAMPVRVTATKKLIMTHSPLTHQAAGYFKYPPFPDVITPSVSSTSNPVVIREEQPNSAFELVSDDDYDANWGFGPPDDVKEEGGGGGRLRPVPIMLKYSGPGLVSGVVSKSNEQGLENKQQIKEVLHHNYTSLGLSDKPSLIFHESSTSMEYGRLFLNELFDNQKIKSSYLAEFFIHRQPPCISFTAVQVGNKPPYCIISLSYKLQTPQHREEIQTTINAISKKKRQEAKSDFPNYKLARIWQADRLVVHAQIVGEPLPEPKPCAENPLTTELKEEFKTHGNQFRVIGSTNFLAYPMNDRSNKKFGLKKKLLDESEVVQLNHAHTLSIPPCDNCISTKTVVAALLGDALIRGIEKNASSKKRKEPSSAFESAFDMFSDDTVTASSSSSSSSNSPAPLSCLLSNSPAPLSSPSSSSSADGFPLSNSLLSSHSILASPRSLSSSPPLLDNKPTPHTRSFPVEETSSSSPSVKK